MVVIVKDYVFFSHTSVKISFLPRTHQKSQRHPKTKQQPKRGGRDAPGAAQLELLAISGDDHSAAQGSATCQQGGSH